jgi:hypothetical protein
MRRVRPPRTGIREDRRSRWRGWRGRSGAAVVFALIAGPPQILWWSDRLDFAEKLGLEGVIVALALGLPALLIAMEHASMLGVVAKDLPTRSIGSFPGYLPEIARLVDRATERITILCDTPGYGMFSNSRAFSEYLAALRRKIDDSDVRVECILLDDREREQLHRAQVKPHIDDWSRWREDHRDECAAFAVLSRQLRGASGKERPDPGTCSATPDEYVQSLMELNAILLERKLHGVDDLQLLQLRDAEDRVHALRQGPSVYVWIRDATQEAIFVLVPVRGTGVRSLAGFITREPALIKALGSVVARHAEGANPSSVATHDAVPASDA